MSQRLPAAREPPPDSMRAGNVPTVMRTTTSKTHMIVRVRRPSCLIHDALRTLASQQDHHSPHSFHHHRTTCLVPSCHQSPLPDFPLLTRRTLWRRTHLCTQCFLRWRVCCRHSPTTMAQGLAATCAVRTTIAKATVHKGAHALLSMETID